MACMRLRWSPPATNLCYERKNCPRLSRQTLRPLEFPRVFCSSCVSQGEMTGSPHDPGRRKDGRVQAGRTGVSLSPSCQPQAGRRGAAGPAVRSAQREWASGWVSRHPRPRRRPLTQQQHVLPGRELGARARGDLAEDAGPNGEQGAS